MAPEAWKEIKLSDLVDVKHGFAFQGENIREQPPGDILLTPGNFAVGGGFKGDKFKYFDGPVPEEYVLHENDLIVTMTDLSKQGDTLGYPALVPRPINARYLHNQRLGKVLVRDEAVADKRFLSYLLRSNEYRNEILASATGTTVKHTSPSRILAFKTSIPPLAEQRAIAHILGTLDEKIELNRRMEGTLETMTRALFKSWFVDFDPVRARAEGRAPGVSKDISGLFSDSFKDSDLGAIPEGWEVKRLVDCVDVVRGLSYKGSGLSVDGVPMHNLNSILEGGGYKHDGLKGYKGAYKSQHAAFSGDLIVANTEQGHDRLLIGYAAIVPARFGRHGLFTHHIYRVRPKPDSELTADFLCHLLNTRTMHDIVSGFANGTTVNMLPIDALQAPLIVVPSPQVISAFSELAAAARLRCEAMIEESHTLARLRDSLLPKLISGAIRVANSEMPIESAA